MLVTCLFCFVNSKWRDLRRMEFEQNKMLQHLFNVLRGESLHHSHTFSFLYSTNRFISLDMRFKFSETTICLTYMMTWLDATGVTNGTISDVWGWSHHQGFPKSGFIVTALTFLHINIYFKLWYILYTTLYSY